MDQRTTLIIGGVFAGFIAYSFIVALIFQFMAGLPQMPMPWYPWILALQGLSGTYIGNASGQLIVSFGAPFVALLFAAGGMHDLIKRKNNGMPDAHWATWRDMKKSGLTGNNGVMLGKYKNKYIMSNTPTHVMVASPTRSGKGVGIVVPNILNFNGTVVCLDVKHENHELTSGFREQYGKVFKWAPMSEDNKSHCYNPFSSISKDKFRRVTELQIFADILIPDPPKGDPMWTTEARALFVGLALYVFETEEEPTIGAIKRLLSSEADLGDICRHLVETHDEIISSSIEGPLNNFALKAAKEKSGVKSSINKALTLWDNPVIDSATSRSDFDISRLRKERQTIYVSVGVDEISTLQPLLRLFFEQVIKQLTKKRPQSDEPHPVLLVMDEFHMLGSLEVMKTAFTLLAGYNVRIIAVTQSLSWLETAYGRPTRNGILSCCAHQIFYAANDEDIKAYVSNACGERTITIESTSQRNSFSYEPQTRNLSVRTVPLISKQEMHNLDRDKEVILVEAGLPILADKVKYFDDPALSMRAKVPQSKVPDLDIIEKAIPKFNIASEEKNEPVKDPNQGDMLDKVSLGNDLDLSSNLTDDEPENDNLDNKLDDDTDKAA